MTGLLRRRYNMAPRRPSSGSLGPAMLVVPVLGPELTQALEVVEEVEKGEDDDEDEDDKTAAAVHVQVEVMIELGLSSVLCFFGTDP